MTSSAAPDRFSWRVKLLAALLSAALSLVAAALIGEWAVRYREAHRETVPGTAPFLFYRHARLGHALVRDQSYYRWMHVNWQGFRGRDVTMLPAPGTFRIMVVGSSTTFDPAVTSDDRAWPARLEHYLRQKTRRPIEVINAGVPGYTLLDNLVRLQSELFEYQPALIVLYEGHNDLFQGVRRAAALSGDVEARASKTPNELPVVTPWGYWLGRHSLLYAKIVGRWDAIKGRRLRPKSATVEARPSAPAPDSTVTQPMERNLAAFLVASQVLGIPVVVPELVQVAGPDTITALPRDVSRMWALASPLAPPERMRRLYAQYAAIIRATAPRFGAPVISTASFGLVGPSWYADQDPIHFNDRGADLMAQKMAESLLAAHLIDEHKP